MIPNPKISFDSESKLVLKIVGAISVLTILASGYSFFINNVWKPKVKVLAVDFENGFATLQLPFGKQIDIYGDSQFLIGGDWGVKFGTVNRAGKTKYENIQLIKKGLVEEYLDTTEAENKDLTDIIPTS